MWQNAVEWDSPQMAVWRTRTACPITMAIHTHTHTRARSQTHPEYVIIIYLPLQHLLYDHSSVLSYTYIALF